MPHVLRTVAECRAWRAAQGRRLGFVPTMGALHAGHATLFQRAKAGNDLVLASVFVNPTQFDDPRDFNLYPRTLDADAALMDASGVDAVFVPSVDEMYPNGTRYLVHEDQLSLILCGAHRPGHFIGMLTVVLKLLQIAQADRAYFGEKDYQQLELVRGLVQAFFVRTEIIAVPTVRESDGLAMSSRNARLNPAERALAPRFHAALNSARTPEAARTQLESEGFRVDYIEDRDGRRFGAVHLGQTRLIDNVAR